MPNTASLLTMSFLISLMAAWMIYKRERLGRMGLAAIALFLLACMGIYAGWAFIFTFFGQVPTWLWLTYCIIPLYFVAVAGYWVWSLLATWGMLWSTTKDWKSSGRTRQEEVPHIQKALLSQGGRVPHWVATCLFWVTPQKGAKAEQRIEQASQ